MLLTVKNCKIIMFCINKCILEGYFQYFTGIEDELGVGALKLHR